MLRSKYWAAGLLASLVVAQTASALTQSPWWWSKELGPAHGREDPQTLVYELGPPSGPDTSGNWDALGWGKDLHFFVVVGPPFWPDGTVVHQAGDNVYPPREQGWEAWGGTCFVGIDSTMLAPAFPMPACVGSDGNLWGFWGPNGQFRITINDPQIRVRPAVASRGDWSFDSFYVHSLTWQVWHTGWSPAGGWIDEPIVVNGLPVFSNPFVGGLDAAWAGYGVSAGWANKILVSYLDGTGAPAVLTGVFDAGFPASNNIRWSSNVVVNSAARPSNFPAIAYVGTPGGTMPTVFYDRNNTCVYQQSVRLPFFTFWSGPVQLAPQVQYVSGDVGSKPSCGDVAARGGPNGPLGAKINFWSESNFLSWGYSR